MQRHVGLPRPPYGEVDDLLFCWEAHRIALGGCDMLLLANASNRFAAFACMQPGAVSYTHLTLPTICSV